MIEIKCTAEEKERLMFIFSMKNPICPFEGLCTELPYYKTGMTHGECVEHNIKWTITDAKPEAEKEEGTKIVITETEFVEAASKVALGYYKPHKQPDNLQSFFANTGYVAMLMSMLFDKEDK